MANNRRDMLPTLACLSALQALAPQEQLVCRLLAPDPLDRFLLYAFILLY